MTTRKFYKYTLTFQVLTENAIGEASDMADIARECDTGDDVGYLADTKEEQLDGAAAAKALIEFGSEPGFFRLDNEGNDTED